jgi:nucleotide-binding universal stress UspA family protein
MISDGGDVLVGVDGSRESVHAVRWAADEAAARGCALVVVHVCDAVTTGPWSSSRSLRAGIRHLTQPLVDDGIAIATDGHPQLPVRGRVIIGATVPALMKLSDQAALVVVGSQGRGAMAAHLIGSVPQRLMAHAHCPVAMVRQPPHLAPVRGVSRVVAAIGDRETDGRTVAFAAREAGYRGVPLLVVHADYVPEWPAGPLSEPALRAEQQQRSDRVRAQAQAALGEHPAVEWSTQFCNGRPAAALRELCRPSDLLVMGQHRQDRFLPATVGPVISHVIHQPPCTVVVVPETP